MVIVYWYVVRLLYSSKGWDFQLLNTGMIAPNDPSAGTYSTSVVTTMIVMRWWWCSWCLLSHQTIQLHSIKSDGSIDSPLLQCILHVTQPLICIYVWRLHYCHAPYWLYSHPFSNRYSLIWSGQVIHGIHCVIHYIEDRILYSFMDRYAFMLDR